MKRITSPFDTHKPICYNGLVTLPNLKESKIIASPIAEKTVLKLTIEKDGKSEIKVFNRQEYVGTKKEKQESIGRQNASIKSNAGHETETTAIKYRSQDIAHIGTINHTTGYTATSLARYYFDQIAPLLTLTALKNIYSNSPNKKILSLMDENIKYLNSAERSQEIFEFWLDENHDVEYVKPIQEKVKNGKLSATDGARLSQNTLQYRKHHSYMMVKNGGRAYRIPIIPYDSLELTAKGKDFVSRDYTNIAHLEYTDILNTCYVALYELLDMGYITNKNDVRNYRVYCYSAINSLIRQSKNIVASLDDTTIFESGSEERNDYSENILSIKSADEQLSSVDAKLVIESVEKCLYDTLPKKCNKENAILAFRYCMLCNFTQEEVAEKIGVSQRMVSKYIANINNVLQSAYTKEQLHKLIIG